MLTYLKKNEHHMVIRRLILGHKWLNLFFITIFIHLGNRVLYANRFLYVLQKKSTNKLCLEPHDTYLLFRTFFSQVNKKKFFIVVFPIRGLYLQQLDFYSFILIVIKNCYGIGNNVWKFQISTMKIVPVACIWSSCIIFIMMTYSLCKGDDNIW